MTHAIYKNNHRAWPPIWGPLTKHWMERDVVFNETAAYDLPGTEDDDDVNKLFGFGYINGGHHQDSARFGWNYNNSTGRIRLFAYCYTNGTRVIHQLGEVLPHKKVRLVVQDIPGKYYSFSVHDGYNNWHQLGAVRIPHTHSKKWKYKLGCFFGGNNPAPHTIKIKITRK